MATPTSAAVGQKITAGQYNQIVGLLVDTGWQTIPPDAAWNAGSTAQYRMIGTHVKFRGTFTKNTGTATTGTLGTLPGNFPPQTVAYPIGYNVSHIGGHIGISTTGVITFTALSAISNTWIDHIDFYTD